MSAGNAANDPPPIGCVVTSIAILLFAFAGVVAWGLGR